MDTKKTLARNLPDGSRIVATLAIANHGSRPYFSLTGELYERHGTWSGAAQQRNGREPDACGQIRDELLRAFPQLVRFAAMHLADARTGEPMHALANGWYFYSGQAEDQQACNVLRVDAIPAGLDEEGFAAFVDSQRERWAGEARAARRFLDGLDDGTGADDAR